MQLPKNSKILKKHMIFFLIRKKNKCLIPELMKMAWTLNLMDSMDFKELEEPKDLVISAKFSKCFKEEWAAADFNLEDFLMVIKKVLVKWMMILEDLEDFLFKDSKVFLRVEINKLLLLKCE
jgi:hypothetical protein